MSPPANDASPEAPDATFTGDPVAHWWSVHFLAGGHTVDEVVEVLSLPELAHVVELHITGCPLGDAGLEQLVEGPWLRNLSVLSLCRVGVTARGLVALARCQSLTGVVRLDLEQNAIGTDGLRTLLAARHLSSLRQLGLVLTGLDAGAADALVESAKLARLHRLDLSQNLLGDDGVATLADFDRYNPELQLVVARNRVSQDVASAATAAMSARVRKFVV